MSAPGPSPCLLRPAATTVNRVRQIRCRDLGISLETALVTARQALTSAAERAKQPGYYSGACADIISAHADLRAALHSLVKAAGPDGRNAGATRSSGTTGLIHRHCARASG